MLLKAVYQTGQPQLARQRLEDLTVAAPVGRVHQLMAQGDQHALDAGDLYASATDLVQQLGVSGHDRNTPETGNSRGTAVDGEQVQSLTRSSAVRRV